MSILRSVANSGGRLVLVLVVDEGGDQGVIDALDALVTERLAARQAARAARDFAAADAVRDSLRDAGVLIEDTPAGARWSLEA